MNRINNNEINVDASNLYKGQVIKNYKELCKLLNWKVSAGNTKKKQFKELDTLCEWHKEGNKIIIDNIFDIVKEKIDMRKYNEGGNNNINYIKYIEALILNSLAENKEGIIFLSKYSLLNKLKMINSNYSFCKGRIEKLSKFSNIDIDNIYEFYESTDGTLIGNLEKALNNLSNKSLIVWSKEKTVCECIDEGNKIEEEIIIDNYGEEFRTYKNTLSLNHRQATDKEIQKILYYENNTIKELNRNNKQDIVRHKEWKLFKEKVNKELLKYGIVYYYDSYKIIFNYEHICEELIDICDYLLSEKEKQDNEYNLNNELIERLKNNTINRKNRALSKTENSFGKSKNEKLNRRINDNYIGNQYNLINMLIKHNYCNIRNDIRKTKVEHN